jgi:hypothetical protein
MTTSTNAQGELTSVGEALAWCDSLQSAAHAVFGDSETGSRLQEAARSLHRDVTRLVGDARSQTGFTVEIQGGPSSGRTTFRSFFLRCPGEARGKPGWGAGTWSSRMPGAAAPPLGPEILDIGRDYTVRDSPDEAGRVLPSLVLYLMKTEDLRDARHFGFIKAHRDCLVAPCVRLAPGEAPDDPGILADIGNRMALYLDQIPGLRLLGPLVLPDLGPNPLARLGEERFLQIQAGLRAVLHDAVGRVDPLEDRLEGQVRSRLSRERSNIAGVLAAPLAKVRPLMENLDSFSGELSHRLGEELLGNENLLVSRARQNAMVAWVDRIPDWFFPYKAFNRVLVFTSGAWDKLFFVAGGSVFSMAGMAFQAAKNLGQWARIQELVSRSASRRLQSIALDEIAGKVAEFQRALSLVGGAPGPAGAAADPLLTPAPKVQGLDNLELACKGLIESRLRYHETPGTRPMAFGLGAMAVFGLLAAPPLIVVYRNYLSACWASMGDPQEGLAAFPEVGFSKVMQIFILCALPVVAIAMFGVTAAVRHSGAAAKAAGARAAVGERIRADLESGKIYVCWNDPRLDAVRFLLSQKKAPND